MRIRFNSAKAIAAAFAFLFIASSVTRTYGLVIDDFSLDQAGIATSQLAAYDTLQSPQLFGGSRTIWGGGATSSTCATCFVTTVTAGQMIVNPGGGTSGAGNVTWNGSSSPADTASMSVDLSGYAALEVDIAEVTGTINARLSIGSNNGRWARKDVVFNATGRHTIYFSSLIPEYSALPLDLHNVRNISLSSGVNLGESVSFDSVHVVVPEPAVITLGGMWLLVLASLRPRRK